MKMETMSLLGGLAVYLPGPERFKTDEKPYGRKVVFLGENGRDGELLEAKKHFQKGEVLTVKEIYVDRNNSEVEFLEKEGERFNTVMYADYEEPGAEKVEGSQIDWECLVRKANRVDGLLKVIQETKEAIKSINRNDIDTSTHDINLNAYLSSETLAEIKRLVIAELTVKIEHDTESLHEILKGGKGNE